MFLLKVSKNIAIARYSLMLLSSHASISHFKWSCPLSIRMDLYDSHDDKASKNYIVVQSTKLSLLLSIVQSAWLS